MKKYVIFFILTLFLSSAFAQETIDISGKIRGLGDESLILRYRFDGTTHMDTITAKNDVFSFRKDIKLPHPIWATLLVPGATPNVATFTTDFFIDNNISIVIDGDLSDGTRVTAQNSPFFDEIAKLREINREDNSALMVLRGEWMALLSGGASREDSAVKVLGEQLSEIQKRMTERQDDFIKNNPNSIYAAYLYSLQLLGKSADEVELVFNRFTAEVQNSAFGRTIHTYLERAKIVAPGAVAPNFTQKDINGNTVTLEQFKGQHVMLVFWGSWCGPCRRSHPHLVQKVEKYRNEIQFIGFASDRDRNAWKKAIEDDKLDFIHCNLFDRLNGEDVAALYNVRAFPTKVFIDPQGKIIRTVIGTDANELDELLKTAIGR